MTDLTRWSLPADFVAQITAMLPKVTDADWAAFAVLADADKIVRDDNSPHPAFTSWAAGVLER